MEKKNTPINQLSTKDLCMDLFRAFTDFESRLVETIKELSLKPEKVVFGYIGNERESYFSPFRYLLLSIFASYLSYTFLYKPEEIGGPFYQLFYKGVQAGIDLANSKNQAQQMIFNQQAFDAYYLELAHLTTVFFKFVACFAVPSLFLASLIILRQLNMTGPCLIVLATYLASHAALISSLVQAPIMATLGNGYLASYMSQIPQIAYLIFAFWRLGLGRVSKPFKRALMTAATSMVFFYTTNLVYGIALTKYIRSYTSPYFKIVPNSKPKTKKTPELSKNSRMPNP
ncbi:MAG: DUF3667 domain-containing protein [Pseudomonadota bacterium]